MEPIKLQSNQIEAFINQYSKQVEADCIEHLQEFNYAEALKRLENINPVIYAKTRNYLDGAITKLSPFISAKMICIDQLVTQVLKQYTYYESEKLLMEFMWRTYFRSFLNLHPMAIDQDMQPYKTGYVASDYADELPADIKQAKTLNASINAFITTLITTGYLHNHARMYLSAYVVHFRKIKWQVGAKWMISYLLDGDHASNSLSWQWVASTNSSKPYYFNLENIEKYAKGLVDTSVANNPELVGCYDELALKLFRE